MGDSGDRVAYLFQKEVIMAAKSKPINTKKAAAAALAFGIGMTLASPCLFRRADDA